MLDFVTVFHRGGTILWSHNNNTNNTNADIHTPLNNFITDILINEQTLKNNTYRYKDSSIKYRIVNQYSIVVIAMYLNITNLLYVDDLLHSIANDFCSHYNTQLTNFYSALPDYNDYGTRYQRILRKYELQSVSHVSKPVTNENITPKTITNSQSEHNIQQSKLDQHINNENTTDTDIQHNNENGLKQSQSSDPMQVNTLLQPRTTPRKPGPMRKKGSSSNQTSDNESSTGKKSKGKQLRTWDGQVSKHEAKSLDRSENSSLNASDIEQLKLNDIKQKFYADNGKPVDYSDDDSSDIDIDDADEQQSTAPTSWFGKTFNNISKNVTGVLQGRTLDSNDLQPVIDALKSQLMSKNVAADIATTLCQQVHDKLINTKTQSFTTIKSIVRDAVESALTRVLTPRKPVDVLQGVEQAKAQKRPYSIVMIGVNGVGKSTSLSKIASYFISKNYSVGFGACDTFRAGAIEQLRTHATVLDVPLYSQGYDKDAATVAYNAIQSAKRDQLDVVLIDTAGRMQHNEPLMKALCKLIQLNQPDLILFVGEALVGNDAVDQITEFNRSLVDYSDTDKPRLIDGIVLTKFDTIDDKVGAAISLTYTTGLPIVFVGTGQTYRDLKKLNVKTINKLLLK